MFSFSTLLAHAGENHETAAEAAQHAAGFTIHASALFWLVLLFGSALILIILQLVKIQLPTKLLLLSFFLITYSIISYQNPGLYSAISLSLGFGIVLFLSLAGLSKQ